MKTHQYTRLISKGAIDINSSNHTLADLETISNGLYNELCEKGEEVSFQLRIIGDNYQFYDPAKSNFIYGVMNLNKDGVRRVKACFKHISDMLTDESFREIRQAENTELSMKDRMNKISEAYQLMQNSRLNLGRVISIEKAFCSHKTVVVKDVYWEIINFNNMPYLNQLKDTKKVLTLLENKYKLVLEEEA